MPPVIECDRLTKVFGSVVAVEDLSLDVHPGEVFGFLGPNGAGKTTTIRVLMDLARATSGTARLFGLDSRRDSLAIHRRVGLLTGDTAFFERLSGGEQLRWLGELRGNVTPSDIASLADRLGLDLSRPIRSLSRGNRQKVALVQAFMHHPDLLILDEPSAGLDPLVQDTFHALVNEAAMAGRTVFLSSHVLEEVDHLCHRVGIIREGRLVAVERVDELRARAGRDVTIRFGAPTDPAAVLGLPGISRTVASPAGDSLSFRFTGDMDALVKELARHDVSDVVSTPPDLEEIFLGYYRGDGTSGGS